MEHPLNDMRPAQKINSVCVIFVADYAHICFDGNHALVKLTLGQFWYKLCWYIQISDSLTIKFSIETPNRRQIAKLTLNNRTAKK